eukprot:4546195-Pyramimonas_sp.AAC.1
MRSRRKTEEPSEGPKFKYKDVKQSAAVLAKKNAQTAAGQAAKEHRDLLNAKAKEAADYEAAKLAERNAKINWSREQAAKYTLEGLGTFKEGDMKEVDPNVLAVFRSDQIKAISVEGIATLSSAQMKQLSLVQIKEMSKEQLAELTDEQLAVLSPDFKMQVKDTLADYLKTEAAKYTVERLKSLTTEETRSLGGGVLATFSAEQIQALSEDSIDSFAVYQLKRLTRELDRAHTKASWVYSKCAPYAHSYSRDGPIGRRMHRYILMMDQSDDAKRVTPLGTLGGTT